MRSVISIAMGLILSGCGWLQSQPPSSYVPLVTSAMDAFVSEANRRGAKIDDAPLHCEHEWTPAPDGNGGTLLVLCEAEIL